MEFSDLNLHPDLQRGINEAGYQTCMPVQEQVLSHAFGGQDLYVQSQTGTGKTAAFLIVIFQRLLSEALLTGKKAIIMVPTRELAVQVEEEAKALSKYLPFKTGSFYGGVGYTQQTRLLRENVQILVGTPGRVLDLNKSGQMNLMDIAFLVLDEADRMFDMGFYPDLRKLIKVVPPADRRQTMLFSATLNAWVKNLAWEYTKSPLEIEIAPEIVTVEEVEQILYHVFSENKMRLLLGILNREQPESAIIFCNTKKYAEIAAKRLRMNGYEAEFIIGDLPQIKRLKIIEDIKKGKLRYLVATDVAARGLDIEGLSLVVNYDLPNEAENYVHRIGRTARAGKTGKAISLASEQDVYELPAIERYIGKKLPSETATDELLGEDKSEGAHIRTEFGTESASDDAWERGNRGRRQGKREERRPAPQGRHRKDEGPRAERSKHTEKKKTGRSGSRGVVREQPDISAKNSHPVGVSLTQLSFEERMAYYKQKYSPEADPSPNEISYESARDEKKPSQAGGKKRRRNRGRKKGREEENVNLSANQEALEKQVSPPAEQNKSGKGIISRLLGFIHKPSSER